VSDAMLELDGLVRHFDGVRAVDDVSFSVERGKVLGFIGHNGAGKTTTMRILATLDTPQRGDARIGGYSVVDAPEQVRRITGFMPDYAGVYANTTVTEYLDFFARAHDLRGEARRRAVDTIIEFMGIGELRDRDVESLSKGLKQRVALGRAIVHDPEVLILDEPAANLDPRARIEFRTLIRELAGDGKTILLSSHILTELAEMCDAVAVIERGRILATGTVQEILRGERDHGLSEQRLASGAFMQFIEIDAEMEVAGGESPMQVHLHGLLHVFVSRLHIEDFVANVACTREQVLAFLDILGSNQ